MQPKPDRGRSAISGVLAAEYLLGHIERMIFTWLFILLGAGIASLIGGECTKDPVAGGALRVIGLLVTVLSLIALIGCRVITSGMRIE